MHSTLKWANSHGCTSFGATSIIRSDIDGAVDFVRRENGLVRMYVELNKGPRWEDLKRVEITPELIIDKCRYLLRPYTVCYPCRR
jgi:phenol 2-monooxygenase